MANTPERVGKGRYLCACFIAACLLIGDGILFSVCISQEHSVLETIFLAIFLLPLMIGIPWGLIASTRWRWQASQIVASWPTISAAPISPLQADRDETLPSGEAIEISRTIPHQRMRKILLGYCVLASIMLYFYERALLALFQIQWPPTLPFDLFMARLPFPIVVALAMPIILTLLLFLPTGLGDRFIRNLSIRADDNGLSVINGRHTTMFRWDEIVVCLYFPTQYGKRHNLTFDGSYVIGNGARQATVKLFFRDMFYPNSQFQFSPRWEWNSEWECILATIAARSHCVMHVPIERLKAAQYMADEEDDLVTEPEASPLAPALIQPRLDLVAAMQHAPVAVVLRSRLRYRALLTLSCWMAFVISPILALWLGIEWYLNAMAHHYDQFRMAFATPTATLDFCAAMVPCIAGVSLCIGWLMARGNRVSIAADANGITDTNIRRKSKPPVAWERVTHWIAAPVTVGSRTGMRYRLYRGGITSFLEWTEWPEDSLAEWGGSRKKFQERAEQLHALIAAKTGLPLLEDQSLPIRKRALFLRLLG